MRVPYTHKLALTALAFAALAMGPSCALANPIVFSTNGQFNIGNFSVAVNGSLATGCVMYYTSASPPPCAAGVTSGVVLNAPADPIFGTVSVNTGTITDLSPQPPFTYPQINSLVMNGAGAITYHFDLLSLSFPTPVPCPPAATPGACAIAGSPFIFIQDTINPPNVTNSVTINLNEILCGYTGASGGVETATNCTNGTLYSGTFSSDFTGVIDNFSGAACGNAVGVACAATVTNLLAIIGSGNTITDSIRGNFTPIITPEPITFILFGSGLLGLSVLGRRRRRS